MTREMIIENLQNRGYNAIPKNAIKNGVELEGIIICNNSNIAPIIYTQEYIERAETDDMSIDDVVSSILKVYEEHKNLKIDVNAFYDRDFVLNHIYIGLQKESQENLIKRNCEDFAGIESYLYIRNNNENGERYSVKLTDVLLEKTNISESDAWIRAERNTFLETKIESVTKVVCDLMDLEYCEEMEDMLQMFVVSNASRDKGASAILNKKALETFGKEYNIDKFIVLPSSIHEMILMPWSEDFDINYLNETVKIINETEVKPIDRLTNRIYIITL